MIIWKQDVSVNINVRISGSNIWCKISKINEKKWDWFQIVRIGEVLRRASFIRSFIHSEDFSIFFGVLGHVYPSITHVMQRLIVISRHFLFLVLSSYPSKVGFVSLLLFVYPSSCLSLLLGLLQFILFIIRMFDRQAPDIKNVANCGDDIILYN